MKKLIITLLVLLLPVCATAEQLASDNFDRADGGLGANWTTVATFNGPLIVSNLVQPAAVGGTNSIALYTGATWPNDQYAMASVTTLLTNNGREFSVIVRGSTAARTGYECLTQGPLGATTTLNIYRFVAGTGTQLATTGANQTVATTDVIRCEVIGNVINLYLNNVLKLSATDSASTITSGTPGIGLFTNAGATTNVQIDNWSGGSIVDTWYVTPAGSCANNGNGLAADCAASPGASGAFLGDATYSNLIWTAVTGIDDGDTLCVINGKHRGSMVPGNSGATNARITIKLDCDGQTEGIMSGAVIETSWTGPDSNGNYKAGGSYYAPYAVVVDGVAAYHGASQATLGTGEWYWDNVSATDVYLHLDPTGHTIEIGTYAPLINGYGSALSNITISGGRFENSAWSTVFSKAAITFMDCANITVENATFYNHRGGIDFRGNCTNAIARNNVMELVSDGVDANLDTAKLPSYIYFIDNTISGTYLSSGGANATMTNWVVNIEVTHDPIDQECVAVTNVGSNIYAIGNTCTNSGDGIFFHLNSAQSNLYMLSNTVHDIGGVGLRFTSSATSIATNVVISGNLVYWCGWLNPASYFGLIFDGYNGGAPGSTFAITNNTIYQCTNAYGINPTSALYALGVFANNIAYKTSEPFAYSSYLFHGNQWQNQSSSIINNNRYFGTSTDNTGGYRKGPSGTYRTSFATYQSDVTPQETNSQYLEPDLVNPGIDFRTRANSTLRGGGLPGYPCKDLRGRPCWSPPDIGAYQATSGDPANTRTAR